MRRFLNSLLVWFPVLVVPGIIVGHARAAVIAADIGNPSIAGADRQTIDNWIGNRLLPVAFVPGGTGGEFPFSNNWGYFGGSIQMADAIRRSDHQMFATAVQTFYAALHQMRNDGSFPMEVRRGACSATYQNVAILHLVSMAEMAATQGYDVAWVTDQLKKGGRDYHVPEDAVISPTSKDNRIEVRVQFKRPISFPGYTYNYEFDHTAKSTAFLTTK